MYRKPQYWRGKQKQEAGAAYEIYVAEQLRNDGWTVEETGRNGFNDHGIDLIASKDGVKRYIQCKGWSREGHIYEDVVSQLYGSVANIEGTDNLEGVEKYIYTPAALDPTAASMAVRLGIKYVRMDYPYEPTYQQRRNWYHPKNIKHFYHYRKHRKQRLN